MAATKLKEEDVGDTVAYMDDEEEVALHRSVETLQDKARRLKVTATNLRLRCNETAELAQKCAEAAGEI